MKLKKIASLFLAMVMVLALAVPAFATVTYSDKNSQSVTMKSATTVPKVQISLPSGAALTNTFLLNPYKVGYSVKIGSDTETTVAADAALTGAQVISPVQVISNATNSKMQVDVTVTTTLGGNLKLMTADYANADARQADTKNNAYLLVAMESKPAGTAAPTATSTVTVSDANRIVLKAGDVKNTNYLQPVAAADAEHPNFIWVQFGGSMAEAPTTPWTDKDTATVAFAFTFTPNQNAAPTST